MHPGDAVRRLSDWLTAQLRAQGLDAASDPVLASRITAAAAAAVEHYRADPRRDINLSLVANSGGQAVGHPIRITPAAMSQILGEQPPPPPPRPPPVQKAAATRVDAPTVFDAPRQPPPPPPPAYAPIPAYPPSPKEPAGNRNGLWWALGLGASVAVAAITAAIVVLIAGGGASDDDDEQPAGGNGTTAADTATLTPTPTPTSTATATPTSTPTPRPTPTPEMHTGREVRVVNTAPDPCLYLRPAPDRTTTPLTCLLVDTRARLLRGPEDLDGIRWWYVEVPDYQDRRWEGYAAEKELASGTTWLIPY